MGDAHPVDRCAVRIDDDLLRRMTDGDRDALAALYDATSTMVLGMATRILGERSLAEDVVVEVYAQAWACARSYDPRRGAPLAWLLAMTRSRAIDLLRRRRRQLSVDPGAGQPVLEAVATPEGQALARERGRRVREALARLSEAQRTAIELAYYQGLSQSEIASHLGEPLGTVKTRIRNGMLILKEHLAEEGA